MCLNPDVEHKLAAEIQAVLGDDTVPSYQQLTEMKYLNAVLKVGDMNQGWIFWLLIARLEAHAQIA